MYTHIYTERKSDHWRLMTVGYDHFISTFSQVKMLYNGTDYQSNEKIK